MGPWQSPPRGGPGNWLIKFWPAKTAVSFFFFCILLITELNLIADLVVYWRLLNT